MKYLKLLNVLAIILFCSMTQARPLKAVATENCQEFYPELVCQTNCESSKNALKTVRSYCLSSEVEAHTQQFNQVTLKWKTITGFNIAFSALAANVLSDSNKNFDSLKKEFNTLKKEYVDHKIEFKKVQDARLVLNLKNTAEERASIVSIDKYIGALDIMLKDKEAFDKFRASYKNEMKEFPQWWKVDDSNDYSQYRGKFLSKELCLYISLVTDEKTQTYLKENLGYTCESK
jgi:hypothetical protein